MDDIEDIKAIERMKDALMKEWAAQQRAEKERAEKERKMAMLWNTDMDDLPVYPKPPPKVVPEGYGEF